MKKMKNVAVPRARAAKVTVILLMMTLFFGTAEPAYADFNKCTSTNALAPFAQLVVDNIVNPIKTFGWVGAGVAVLLATAASAFGRGPAFVRMAVWIVVAMIVGMQFVDTQAVSGGPCKV